MEFLATEMQIPKQKRVYASFFIEDASAKEMLDMKIFLINDSQRQFLLSRIDKTDEVYTNQYTLMLYRGDIYVHNFTYHDQLILLMQAFILKKTGKSDFIAASYHLITNISQIERSIQSQTANIASSISNIRSALSNYKQIRFFNEADLYKACKKYKVKAVKIDSLYMLSFGKCSVTSPVEGTINYKDIIFYVDNMLKIRRIIFKFNDFFYDTKWKWSIKFFHPHINGTFFCMGNKAEDQETYANGLLYDFWLDVTKESLNTYSPDGAPYDTVAGVASTIALITSKIKSINFKKEMKDKTLEEKGEELFTRALLISNLQKCRGCGNYILDGHCTHHHCHHNPDAHMHCPICNTEMVNVIRLGNSYGFNCPRPSCNMHVTIDYENFRMACSSCGQELENRNQLLGNAQLVCCNPSCEIRDLSQARYNRTTHTIELS